MELIKKNIKIFALFGLFVISLLILILTQATYKSPVLKSVSPPNNSKNIPTNSIIIIDFEKDVEKYPIEVEFSPPLQTSKKVAQGKIELTPTENLQTNTTYIMIVKDKKRTIYQASFTTVSPQGSPEDVKDAEKTQRNDYPLSIYSPPDNALFYFTYIGPKQLQVFLKGGQQNAKAEFIKWVNSLGINLSDQQVTYLTPP